MENRPECLARFMVGTGQQPNNDDAHKHMQRVRFFFCSFFASFDACMRRAVCFCLRLLTLVGGRRPASDNQAMIRVAAACTSSWSCLRHQLFFSGDAHSSVSCGRNKVLSP
jgi:hypothetical protein